MTARRTFLERVVDRSAFVSISGLGYVGLRLAIVFVDAGFSVYSFDLEAERARAVNQGRSYIRDVASSTVERLVLGTGRLSAVTDYDDVARSDAVL